MMVFRSLVSAAVLSLACIHSVAAEQRVISAGGSITEIVYALDREETLVAVDSTSFFPAAAQKLPKIGYFRQLSTEGVLSFDPTHVIAMSGAGPDAVLTQLQASGIQLAVLGETKSRQGLYDFILGVAKQVDAQAKAKLLINEIDASLNLLAPKQHQLKNKNLTALFVLTSGDRGLTVAGSDTMPDFLFTQSGLNNGAKAITRYKTMDTEAIIAAAPDLVFVASHNFDNNQAQSLCKHPAIKATPAGQDCSVRIKAISSDLALGMSPRLPLVLNQIIEFGLQE